ncbi:MAG: hypothetical protein WKG07_47025 [Hymenobacter sp.]
MLGLLCVPGLLASCGTNQTGQADQASSKTGTLTPADTSGPEPRVDSVFVIRTMQADARFRAQERWARKFYRERQYRLGWFKQHQLVPQAATFLTVVAKAKDDGLDPKRYDTKQITGMIAALQSADQDTARRNQLERTLDVTLSGSYFAWASDYYRGVVNPRDTKNGAWKVKRNKIKLDHALMTILRERKAPIPTTISRRCTPSTTTSKRRWPCCAPGRRWAAGPRCRPLPISSPARLRPRWACCASACWAAKPPAKPRTRWRPPPGP